MKITFFLQTDSYCDCFKNCLSPPPWNEDLYQCVTAKSTSWQDSYHTKKWMYGNILCGEDVGRKKQSAVGVCFYAKYMTVLHFTLLYAPLLHATRRWLYFTLLCPTRQVTSRHSTPHDSHALFCTHTTSLHFTRLILPRYSRSSIHVSRLFEDKYWYPEILPSAQIPSELWSSEFITTLLLSCLCEHLLVASLELTTLHLRQ